MFKKIGHSLALQFTGFVFLLFLINGSIYLIADFGNARRQMNFRMLRDSQMIMNRVQPDLTEEEDDTIPLHLRGYYRIMDNRGRPVYGGGVLAGVPFTNTRGFSTVTIRNENFYILTSPILFSGQLKGYLQLAEDERAEVFDIPPRVVTYFLISVLISGLTYLVGLYFSRKSLRPAEEMFERLDQFTQDASHELRTPLAVLGSSLDVALKTQRYREGLESAKQDLKQLSKLVERLLEFARLDKFALQKNKVDFSTLVKQTIERFKHLAEEKSLTIDGKVVSEISVYGDESLLKQILNNLVSNAIKFNKINGRINIELADSTLSVADTGIGISPEDIHKIFNRFYQADTSRARGGFGLGLALTKRIIDLHGWNISVNSDPGKGTTFLISFPRAS